MKVESISFDGGIILSALPWQERLYFSSTDSAELRVACNVKTSACILVVVQVVLDSPENKSCVGL